MRRCFSGAFCVLPLLLHAVRGTMNGLVDDSTHPRDPRLPHGANSTDQLDQHQDARDEAESEAGNIDLEGGQGQGLADSAADSWATLADNYEEACGGFNCTQCNQTSDGVKVRPAMGMALQPHHVERCHDLKCNATTESCLVMHHDAVCVRIAASTGGACGACRNLEAPLVQSALSHSVLRVWSSALDV